MRFVLLLVLALSSLQLRCSKSETPVPSAQGVATAAAKASQSPIKLTLTTAPEKLKFDQETTFRVHATDESGSPLTGAKLRGSLVMMTMDMGKNEFDLADKGSGDYEGKAKPTMSGPWEVKITAEKDSLKSEKAFEVRVDD